jgi:hypothetical protein
MAICSTSTYQLTPILACDVGFRHQWRISNAGSSTTGSTARNSGTDQSLTPAGFDDIEQSAWTSYNLATLSQPVDEITNAAVAWLSEPETSDADRQQRLMLHAELVWRSSIRSN